MRDKIRGTFLGVAVGDSLGKPVEMWSADKIKEKFGRITDYQDCKNHKYFQNDEKGTTTDDWALTKAIAKAFINAGKFDMDAIAEEHVKEFAISVGGWGGSTRESVERLANGVHWQDSGKTDKAGRGTGNGICMKVSPIGLALKNSYSNHGFNIKDFNTIIENLVNLSAMTHRTSLAVTSGIAHTFSTLFCINEKFDRSNFISMLENSASIGKKFFPETLTDDLGDRFKKLKNNMTDEEIIREFGGTCYVYDSLPFTYAFFLRNPDSIESLFDCVSAGADCDSNGSMLAGLLGSLHGTKIFPQYLIDGLKAKDEVLTIADQFYEKLYENS